MNQKLWSGLELVGRLLLGFLFVLEGLSKLGQYDATVDYMTTYGLPAQLLPIAIAVELGAGILIMIGWGTRLAAVGLAGFCLIAAVVFHKEFYDRNQLIHFEKDVALAGAFLIVWARGAGSFSIDAHRARQ